MQERFARALQGLDQSSDRAGVVAAGGVDDGVDDGLRRARLGLQQGAVVQGADACGDAQLLQRACLFGAAYQADDFVAVGL